MYVHKYLQVEYNGNRARLSAVPSDSTKNTEHKLEHQETLLCYMVI